MFTYKTVFLNTIIIILTQLICIVSASAESKLSAYKIMQLNDKQRKVADEKVKVDMQLVNKKGKVKKRVIQITTQTDTADLQKSMVRFLEPRSVKGTGLLTIEYTDRADDQWLYLPALKRSRRISPADQSDSFMGTDFAFEDLRAEDLESFNYELKGEENIEGVSCYIIQALPKTKEKQAESGYTKRLLWIRKSDYIAAKIDYFENDELLKTFTATNIKSVAPNIFRAHETKMHDIKTQHKTLLSYGTFTINKGLQKNLFTVRVLENY